MYRPGCLTLIFGAMLIVAWKSDGPTLANIVATCLYVVYVFAELAYLIILDTFTRADEKESHNGTP